MKELNPDLIPVDSSPVAVEPDEVDVLEEMKGLVSGEAATDVSEDARSTEESETSQTSPPRLPEHIAGYAWPIWD
jgi:hypothetical protein